MAEYIRIAVFFAAGIYLHDRISTSFAVTFVLSLSLVLAVQAIFKHKFNLKILILVTSLTAGVLLCRFAASSEKYALSGFIDRYVTVTGRVSELPSPASEGNTSYVISARSFTHRDETREINEKILLTTPSVLSYGDTVTFSGIVKDLPKQMNENGFDLAMYYKNKGIFFRMYASGTRGAEYVINDYSPYSIGLYIKNYISGLIGTRYGGDYAAILKAVLTGNKKEFSDDFDAVLDRTGLKRFYYPAFLHVMLFMSFITALLSLLDRKKREIVTVFLLILYGLFNLSNNVFLKLCVLFTLIIIMKRRYGHLYYPDAVGMTAIVMGILNPIVFYDAGFVMSMLSSVLVYYFYDSVSGMLKFIENAYIRRMVTVGIICNAGLIPISAYFFNGVSFYSICVSFIMLPCVGVILVLSPLLTVMLSLFHAAPLVGQATSFMVFVLKYVPILADKLGHLSHSLAKPGILELVIYLLIMVALVKLIKKKKTHMLYALFTAAALCVSVGAREIRRMSELEITFVNVGQGDGAIINAPYRYTILIDGGGGNAYSGYNPGEKLFLEYLRAEGITTVDSAFVSHYHKDHAQGIVAAIEHLNVRNVFMPDNMEGSEWREEIETAAKQNGTKIHYVSEETLLTYRDGMTLRIIPPAKKTAVSDDENDTTFADYITYGDFSAMFTGDMTKFAEKNLLEGGHVPHANLLKVAHHGSSTSTSPEWVSAVSPLYSVISVGENNTYYLPSRETLETLDNTIIYRTDYDGDVRFTVGRNGVKDVDVFNRRD